MCSYIGQSYLMKSCSQCGKPTTRQNGLCKSCMDAYNKTRILTKEDWVNIPPLTKIRCTGEGFGFHYMDIDQMSLIMLSNKHGYIGYCIWCRIMKNSKYRARKGHYQSLLLPLGETPWTFFPQALIDQKNKCFIPWCTIKQNGIQLSADHDHLTGQFRGFVCMRHNQIFMTGVDEAELNGIIIPLPFTYPGNKYYETPEILPKKLGNFSKEGTPFLQQGIAS